MALVIKLVTLKLLKDSEAYRNSFIFYLPCDIGFVYTIKVTIVVTEHQKPVIGLTLLQKLRFELSRMMVV